MKDIMIVKPDKCVGCKACLRSCPAPEANSIKKMQSDKEIVNINSSKCIACGECIKACPHNARDYIDDTDAFMARLSEEKMIVIADPAIRTAFPNKWKDILNWFKKKGCLIFDGALGADIYVWALLKAIDTHKSEKTISQSCAALSAYIKMYQPELVKKLAPIYSPSVCLSIYIKNNLRRDNKIAVLSPCAAKKIEYTDVGYVDFNVTFKKLMEYFDKNDIVVPSVTYDDIDYEFEDKQGQMGTVISRPGGLCDGILFSGSDIAVESSSGVLKVYPELKLYAKMPAVTLPNVFDAISCEYGCNMGPGSTASQTPFDIAASMRRTELSIKDKFSKGKGALRTGDGKLFKKFDDELRLEDFMIKSTKNPKAYILPKPDEINAAFKTMNKNTKAERTYNCGACGFKTCDDLAIAVCRKLASPDACVRQFGSYSSKALSLNESKLLLENINIITDNIDAISKTNSKIAVKMGSVKELLKKMALFCEKNSSIDENSVKQLLCVLETTVKSFEIFDESTDKLKEETSLVEESVHKMAELLEKK